MTYFQIKVCNRCYSVTVLMIHALACVHPLLDQRCMLYSVSYPEKAVHGASLHTFIQSNDPTLFGYKDNPKSALDTAVDIYVCLFLWVSMSG